MNIMKYNIIQYVMNVISECNGQGEYVMARENLHDTSQLDRLVSMLWKKTLNGSIVISTST